MDVVQVHELGRGRSIRVELNFGLRIALISISFSSSSLSWIGFLFFDPVGSLLNIVNVGVPKIKNIYLCKEKFVLLGEGLMLSRFS